MIYVAKLGEPQTEKIDKTSTTQNTGIADTSPSPAEQAAHNTTQSLLLLQLLLLLLSCRELQYWFEHRC